MSEYENQRIQKLHEYRILDTSPEQSFDDIVSLAAQICGTPFALITLIDSDREWFKAKKGIAANENSRYGGFGAQTISYQDVMVVSNADNDTRFLTNSFRIGEGVVKVLSSGMPTWMLVSRATQEQLPRRSGEGKYNTLLISKFLTGYYLEKRKIIPFTTPSMIRKVPLFTACRESADGNDISSPSSVSKFSICRFQSTKKTCI